MSEDAYPTPSWCVRRLLESVPFPTGEWCEPCAGDGAILREVRDWHGGAVRLGAIDIRDEREAQMVAGSGWCVVGDYLTMKPVAMDGCQVIITNPPFSLALPIIKKALTEAAWVAMLLRLNFLGSAERSSWLRADMPDIYTLPDRPNFVASYKCKPKDSHDRGCGWHALLPIAADAVKACPVCGRKVQRSTSDSAEYAWFVWTPERGRKAGKVCILASTPEAERKAIPVVGARMLETGT
jgi:hypothetical protein